MQRCLINPDCFAQRGYTRECYIKMSNFFYITPLSCERFIYIYIYILVKHNIENNLEFQSKSNSIIETLLLLTLRPLYLSNHFHIYLIYVNNV